MKLTEFKETLDNICNNLEDMENQEVAIILLDEGSVCGRDTVGVDSVLIGFDWHMNKILITPNQPLMRKDKKNFVLNVAKCLGELTATDLFTLQTALCDELTIRYRKEVNESIATYNELTMKNEQLTQCISDIEDIISDTKEGDDCVKDILAKIEEVRG